MSFTDRLMIWFHVAFVVFTIGPVTIATMSTPRYIRARNVPVLRYLSRMTRVFGAASLGVLLFGIIAGQSLHDLATSWLSVSMTLFVVALVLLVLIMRDQHRAIVALEASLAPAGTGPAVDQAAGGAAEPGAAAPPTAEPTAADAKPAPAAPQATATATATGPGTQNVATVERGRIASMAGVVSVIWLVILVLMIWNSTGH